jgi:hypothetical protein
VSRVTPEKLITIASQISANQLAQKMANARPKLFEQTTRFDKLFLKPLFSRPIFQLE